MKRNEIEYGDNIYARLMMHGKMVVEFMINRVSDMTELIGELRHLTYGARGLATLQIRNHTKGWSLERPLMLYSPTAPGGQYAQVEQPRRERRMLFPWECH